MLTALTAGAASAATPFTPEQLQYPYPSNATYDYVPIIDQFTQLRADRPDILALNDSQTVAINQAATDLESERAIIDQYDDMSVSMHDGMGERVGAIYRDARLAGELPKTQALLAKSGGLIGYYSSSNPAKQHFSYDRPYIRFPELLEYRDKEGGDAWASTSGAYPSGHTSQAYWQGTALATMLPELAPQILARTSEAGHNRIVMAAHYPLDVMSGRMMGQHIVERRWSDPEFRVLLEEASAELHTVLEAGCGVPLAECIAADTPYLPEDEALAVYEARMSYAFPQIAAAGQPVTVPENAESLLLTSHPDLTPEQRRQVLALTAIDSGYPLDEGAEGSWQRLDLAAAMAADVTVAADGTVSLVAAPAPVDPTPAPEPEPGPTPVLPAPGDPGTAPAPGEGEAGTDPVDAAPVAVEPAAPAGGAATGTAAGRDPQAVAPTASGRDGLAYTGSDALLGVAGAALALLGGGTALVLRRRRASARG
ncbi:acid phosphatase [Frigoribacterium salinisoli]